VVAVSEHGSAAAPVLAIAKHGIDISRGRDLESLQASMLWREYNPKK
jgi:hypothetical protein